MDAAGFSFGAIVLLIAIALAFDFLNGFHDAANSIATIVSTRVLRPHYAVAWAAFFNFIAFLVFGLHVANTIGTGVIDPSIVDHYVILGALLGAIAWNLLTWYYGIPSSSSHALIGGLIGAALASAHGSWNVVVWSSGTGHWWQKGGVIYKVIIPMFTSPICGLVLGFCVMGML